MGNEACLKITWQPEGHELGSGMKRIHGQEEKSQNVIEVQLAQEKSHFEHRSSNISKSGDHESSKCPSEDNEEDDRKPAAKRICRILRLTTLNSSSSMCQ